MTANQFLASLEDSCRSIGGGVSIKKESRRSEYSKGKEFLLS